jgi:hypothetical protein
MAESTVRGFVVREKQYSLAEKVQLIKQANRAKHDIRNIINHDK